MICSKKVEKLANMIKKSKLIIILFLLIPLKSLAFSEKNEQQLYLGCYQNSKQYLGADKAKTYCQCTVNKLSEKFSDDELNTIFKQKPEDIVKDTQFASEFCEKKILK
jgi:arginine utilization protein RocB